MGLGVACFALRFGVVFLHVGRCGPGSKKI